MRCGPEYYFGKVDRRLKISALESGDNLKARALGQKTRSGRDGGIKVIVDLAEAILPPSGAARR